MIATWKQIDLDGLASAPGWHYDDPSKVEKLAASLRRHGQLRALVVRTSARGLEVVDGRWLLAAMRREGWTKAWVADVGPLDDESSVRMSLDLELRFELDYARIAVAIKTLVDAGVESASLAAASPFTKDRIDQLARLAGFNWESFKAQDNQVGLDWGAEPDVEIHVPDVPVVDMPYVLDVPAVAKEDVVEIPVVHCPRCGFAIKDLDGFGFVACAECGLCTHPSRDGGVCGICGDAEGLAEEPPLPPEMSQAEEPPAEALQMGLF